MNLKNLKKQAKLSTTYWESPKVQHRLVSEWCKSQVDNTKDDTSSDENKV